MQRGNAPDQRAEVDRGFTLVRLVLAIAGVGVIASVAAGGISGVRNHVSATGCGSDDRELTIAAETYFARTGADAIPATGSDSDRFERTLVEAGLMTSPSRYQRLDADGSVTSELGAPC